MRLVSENPDKDDLDPLWQKFCKDAIRFDHGGLMDAIRVGRVVDKQGTLSSLSATVRDQLEKRGLEDAESLRLLQEIERRYPSMPQVTYHLRRDALRKSRESGIKKGLSVRPLYLVIDLVSGQYEGLHSLQAYASSAQVHRNAYK